MNQAASGIGKAVFRLLFVLVALPLCLTVARQARAQDTAYWPYFSFPPMVVLDGEADGQDVPSGISITIQDMIFDALPEFDHQRIQSPFTRSMANVKAGQTFCFTGLLRSPEREQWLVYSLPCRLSAPNVVVARKGELDGLAQDGAVSVARLLGQPDLQLGLVSGFSHGPLLDRIIAAAPADSLYNIHSLESVAHQLELLLAGRIDWLITFPAQVLYQASRSGVLDQVDLIPIAEPQKYIVGHVACTDNELGRQVIQGVNRVLAEQVPRAAYRDIFLDWVAEDQRGEFMEQYERLLADPARAWRP